MKSAILDRKTVAFISTNADRAGAPLHVQELALGVSEIIGRVVVLFGEDGPVREAICARGIENYVVPTMRSKLNIIQDLRAILKIKSILCDVRPNIIHAHSSKAGMIARVVGNILDIPVIYTVHGWGFGAGRRKMISAIVRTIEFVLKYRTSHFIAVSNADRQIGIDSLGVRSKCISTIHNGIADCSLQADPLNSEVVVMVARNDHQKDYGTLFKAVETLSCEVWCIGRGTDTDDFKELAKSLAPSAFSRMKFLGARSDVAELLSKAGIFVLSSRFEGLPISIIEAMRSGLPVVASNVGGVSELVSENVTGLLFNSGDATALKHHLQNLLDNNKLRKFLGENGRKAYIENFTSEKMISKVLIIYSSVLSIA